MKLGKLYAFLVKFCSLFGALGAKIQSWAEFKEWKYWNDRRTKIIDLPKDVKVFITYDNKGDFVNVSMSYWPMVDGSYDWRNRPDVMRQEFTRDQILQLATKTEAKE